MVQVVYLVAGMSNRFNGKVKQLAKVGPNDETLIEISMMQAISAGIKEIIFVVGEKTHIPFKEMFGSSYQGISIKYAFQRYDRTKRDKPWGTTDAVCCAKDLIKNKFIVCNGDDLYGRDPFEKLIGHFSESNSDAIVAWKLEKVLPETGNVSRGIVGTDKGYVTDIEEVKSISKLNLPLHVKEDSLCSLNFFGLTKKTLLLLEENLNKFKYNNDSRDAECYMPIEISNLIKTNKIKMKVYTSEEPWIGITNPEDELVVKKFISSIHNKNIIPQNFHNNF
jgi:choline kinase